MDDGGPLFTINSERFSSASGSVYALRVVPPAPTSGEGGQDETRSTPITISARDSPVVVLRVSDTRTRSRTSSSPPRVLTSSADHPLFPVQVKCLLGKPHQWIRLIIGHHAVWTSLAAQMLLSMSVVMAAASPTESTLPWLDWSMCWCCCFFWLL